MIEDGGKSDFHYGKDWQIMGQPPVKVDRVLREGDAVRLGEVVLTAHHTAGHTRGATTWTTTLVLTIHFPIVAVPIVAVPIIGGTWVGGRRARRLPAHVGIRRGVTTRRYFDAHCANCLSARRAFTPRLLLPMKA